MNKKIVTFLDDVCIHIRCKKIHIKDLRDELTNHIYELKEDLIELHWWSKNNSFFGILRMS